MFAMLARSQIYTQGAIGVKWMYSCRTGERVETTDFANSSRSGLAQAVSALEDAGCEPERGKAGARHQRPDGRLNIELWS